MDNFWENKLFDLLCVRDTRKDAEAKAILRLAPPSLDFNWINENTEDWGFLHIAC